MKTLTKLLGVGGLLAALGSGCDRDETRRLGQCEVDISTVKVLYNEKNMKNDTYTIQFLGKEGNISQMEFLWNSDRFRGGAFACKDGSTMVIAADGNVYFTGGN